MPHVTIIGGGIAGLATAFYLQQKSQAANISLNYTLIDSSSRFGGKIITEFTDDFIIEGGPDSFVTLKPGGTQLCQDLELEDSIIPTNDDRRNVFVLKKGKLIPFPSGYRLTIPTEFMPFALSPLISPLGKLRMGLDLFIPRRKETGDESLASFIKRRLGNEALDKIAGPIMAGIYVADPEKLSLQSTFPQFSAMEQHYGSLIMAMQKAKKKRPPSPNSNQKPKAMFTSLQGGMTELVKTLLKQLTGDLQLNTQVTALNYQAPGFEVGCNTPNGPQTLPTDAVVLAIPAFTTATLLEAIEPQLAELCKAIRYTSTATVSLGYRRADIVGQHDFDGFGFVIPKSENRKILACTWTSTKFNHRAPDDSVLLRAFVGGDAHGNLINLPDDELISLMKDEVSQTMGVTAEPIVCKIFRWANGNPQYDVGHLDRVSQIETLSEGIQGLYLTGSAFRGIGIPDCVQNAQTTVDKILVDLN